MVYTKVNDKQNVLITPTVKKVQVKYTADYEPKFATEGSAGFDLQTVQKERIYPGTLTKVDLGIKFEIPEGYYLEIAARGSLQKKGLILGNSIGIIDSDYRGSVFAGLRNLSKKKVILESGERVVQGILHKLENVELVPTKTLTKTDRGEGGYGSTGK